MFNINDKVVSKASEELATGEVKEIYTPEAYIEVVNRGRANAPWEETYPDWASNNIYGVELDDFLREVGYNEFRQDYLDREDEFTPIINYVYDNKPEIIEKLIREEYNRNSEAAGKYIYCPEEALGLVYEGDLTNKYKIGTRITGKKYGVLAPSTIVGMNLPQTSSFGVAMMEMTLGFNKDYESWAEAPIYLAQYDEPIPTVSLAEFIKKAESAENELTEFAKELKTVAYKLYEKYMKISYNISIPKKKNVLLPEADIEVISEPDE